MSDQSIKTRAFLDQRLGALREERQPFFMHWQEIAKYLYPRRFSWLSTTAIGSTQSSKVQWINNAIIDNTAMRALGTLSAGMMSGITSPGRPWFRLGITNAVAADNQEVKIWLEESTKRMLSVMGQSNFYTSIQQVYGDLGAFASALMYIQEDDEDVFRCDVAMAGEYFLGQNQRREVDSVYREFVWTVKQVVQRFGDNGNDLSKLSTQTAADWTAGGAQLNKKVRIGHAIEPNIYKKIGLAGPKGMDWREVYWEIGSNQSDVLEEKGYEERNFIAPRWDPRPGEAYGAGSPGMNSLGDNKQLQVQQKRKGQAIDKMVNPPMTAPASLKNQPASILPGGITYVDDADGRASFKPAYQVNPDINALAQDMQEVRDRIQKTFYVDVFLMIAQLDTVRTATEINARQQEKLIQLGPILERFENEALDISVKRIFSIMLRRGLFPPIPQQLAGQTVSVDYISIMADAQKAAATTGMEQFAAMVGNLGAADPAVYDAVDKDEFVTEYGSLLSVSPKIIRSKDQISQIRQQRTQQMAEQQQAAQTQAAVEGAKTLSQTNVGGGQNALQAMLGA